MQPVLKPYNTIKKVKSWDICKTKCDEDVECQYFKWKVIFHIEASVNDN